MKKLILLSVFFLVFSLVHISAQTSSSNSGAEISFTFNRQFGVGTNQFAVWIEDSRGNFVKTLYATRFTATGGWQRRPLSIPVWVKQSGISSLSKAEVDALTGATPRNGALNYKWDGTDKNGMALPSGEYRIFIEGTLRAENQVVYSALFSPGNSASGSQVEAELKTEYKGNSTSNRNMISNVKVLYRP